MCKTLPSLPKLSARAHLCVFRVKEAEQLERALRKKTQKLSITDTKAWPMEKDWKVSPSSKWPRREVGW